MFRLETPDIERQRDTQKRHLLDLKLGYETQLDDKEEELKQLIEQDRLNFELDNKDAQ